MLRAHDAERMRVEGDEHAAPAGGFGPTADLLQNGQVTEVDAVEGADGGHGPSVGREAGGIRPLHRTAHETKTFLGLRRPSSTSATARSAPAFATATKPLGAPSSRRNL